MRLNLARSWRPQAFDDVVGQEIAVTILKNSLYRNYFVPVYIFTGQKGCGKTTAARIFAAAINCASLETFQKNPKGCSLPCGMCDSCTAMKMQQHPDFIEIDAASHTGVDNVRSVIEMASFLPLLGRKKIYLIDEAHMLSKAAFSAFLKMLEEPPLTALFILATTDVHKILDTVRSRSLHVLFKMLSVPALQKHLEVICTAETISFTAEGLAKIAAAAQGSVRDAINLLEQVRLASDSVDQSAVEHILGLVPDEYVHTLLQYALRGDVENLIAYRAQTASQVYDTNMVWRMLVTLLRNELFAKTDNDTDSHKMLVDGNGVAFSRERLLHALQIWCSYEQIFINSRHQHYIIEMFLIALAKNEPVYKKEAIETPVRMPIHKAQRPVIATEAKPQSIVQHAAPSIATKPSEPVRNHVWDAFIQEIHKLDDPLLLSVFTNAAVQHIDEHAVRIQFPENFSFFAEIIQTTESSWRPLVHVAFGQALSLEYTFDGQVVPQKSEVRQVAQAMPVKTNAIQEAKPKIYHNRATESSDFYKKKKEFNGPRLKPFNVNNWHEWPKAQLVMDQFKGTIVERE